MTQRGIEPGAFLLCQDESLRKTISPKEDWRTGRLDSSKAGGLEAWRAGSRHWFRCFQPTHLHLQTWSQESLCSLYT